MLGGNSQFCSYIYVAMLGSIDILNLVLLLCLWKATGRTQSDCALLGRTYGMAANNSLPPVASEYRRIFRAYT
jgi:hypothetical protein